jgi:hypothetical protein
MRADPSFRPGAQDVMVRELPVMRSWRQAKTAPCEAELCSRSAEAGYGVSKEGECECTGAGPGPKIETPGRGKSKQTVPTLLMVITIGILAIMRGRSAWWGIIAAVLFVIIDTVGALSLLSLFNEALHSDASAILLTVAGKVVVFGVCVAIFYAKLKRVEGPAPDPVKDTIFGDK